MLVISSVWLIPQPVTANVIYHQTTQSVAQVEVQSDERPGVLQPEQVVQPADPKPVPQPAVKKAKNKPKKAEAPNNPPKDDGRSYSKEEVISLINDYSKQYGISPEAPL